MTGSSWQSNAIIRYLAARHGVGSLSPETVADRARADQWMEWYKTTLFPDYVKLFLATVRTEPAEREPTTIAALARSLGSSLAILDRQLTRHPYLTGDRLTMADIPFGPAIHRTLQLDVERPALPHLTAWHERLSERPAYREHVMFPFGSNPSEWNALEGAGALARQR